jgi:hypothetical protein
MTGVAELLRDDQRVLAVADAAGVAAEHAHHRTPEAFPCVLTNMTTEDLARVRFGAHREGGSVVVKVARSPRHSPLWQQIPADHREAVLTELPWRAETDMYASPLASLLPPGLRMPVLYAIDELNDERLALWMEDVVERPGAWDTSDYALAARALGRLAGRFTEGAIPAEIPVQRRDLRRYFFGRVQLGTLPVLRADATWSHPLVAGAVDAALRHDLEMLVMAAPGLLDRVDRLPRTLAHGDACPQNLLLPAAERDVVVAIDWTFAGVCPVGMDAGQLLAGRAESGELEPVELPNVFERVVDAYLAGLDEERPGMDPAGVRLGIIGNLVIRSAFTALPVELLDVHDTGEAGDVAGLKTLFQRRARYARFLVDLAGEVVA